MTQRNLRPSLFVGAVASVCVLTLGACFSGNESRYTQPHAVAQNTKSVESTPSPPREPIGPQRNGIRLVYPHDGSTIDAPSTFLVGAVAPGTTLTENGRPVKVNAAGFFAEVVPLVRGDNHFELVKNGDATQNFALTLHRPMPPHSVAEDPAQIVASTIQPAQDLGVEPGDIVTLSMRGSPGSRVAAAIGSRTVQLHPAASKGSSPVNQGLDTTFGVTYQQSAVASQDLYTGFYRVTADDKWQNEQPIFTLSRAGSSVSQPSTGRITVINQPFIVTTAHDDTVVRVGPGAARTTPLVQGVRVLVDGFAGDSYRCEMAPGKHLWIEKKDVTESEAAGLPPTASVRTINIENEGTDGARIVIPLNQRLAYEVKQEVVSVNKLQLRIYGATADTDWITEPSTSSTAVSSAAVPNAATPAKRIGKTFPNPADRQRNPVGSVTWQQMADRVYQVTVNLNGRQQWGYWADYDGTRLLLHVKGAPAVTPGLATLKGLRVCLDPGHGGQETGAIGCSGIKEATLNFGIAKRVERLLQQQGAEVITTRQSDVDVGLNERVQIAINAKADLLVSIHNNALPDGRNPWTEHGTSSYYYQPQSLALASAIRQGVVKDLGFNDFHTRWQNLALCRPSNMPAQLVEVGFMVNPDEYASLLSDSGQERAAQGIVEGIHNFINQAMSKAPLKAASAKQIKHHK